MLKFFNKLFSKGKKPDSPAISESRWLPGGISQEQDADGSGWMTTQVFSYKKDKSRRIYCAAVFHYNHWCVDEYAYSVGQDGSFSALEQGRIYQNMPDARDVIIAFAEFERKFAKNPALLPVDGLDGNYKVAASAYGVHFDDQGNYMEVKQDAPVAAEATFDRKDLDALYSQPKETAPPAETPIATWDDYYREIVEKQALDKNAFDAVPKNRYFRRYLEGSAELIARVKTLNGANPSVAKEFIFSDSDYIGEEDNKFSDYPPAVGYQHSVFVLTAYMRAGSHIYRQFAQSMASIAEDTQQNAQALSVAGQHIENFARFALNYSPARAKQIAALIMQGPDPYADKPLPFEELIAAQPLNSFVPSKKKKISRGPR